MDFIERIFHLSPDNGDGSLEAAILAVVAVLLSLIALTMIQQCLRFSLPSRRLFDEPLTALSRIYDIQVGNRRKSKA